MTISAPAPVSETGGTTTWRDPKAFVEPGVWDRQIKLLVRDHPFDTVMAERLFGQAVAYLITAMEKFGQHLEIGCGELVDTAVHAFILDTVNYRNFCHKYFDRKFLEHVPEIARKYDGSVERTAHVIEGIEATGIDISPAQCERARRCWGHLPGARYVDADVVDYLTATEQRWEAIYSIWGAVWFIDPARLFPLIHARLAPGGKLVFSHAPAVPGSYGVQGIYAAGFTGRQVWAYRWAYEPSTWADLLRGYGFTAVNARSEPAPEADHVGTLIVEAAK